MKKRLNQAMALITATAFLTNCTSLKSEQFAYAAAHGDVSKASRLIGPGDVNMRIYDQNNRYAVPIQYAIVQGNTQMADMLLKNGAKTQLNGGNLAYYSASRGKDSMARYFVKKGIGSSSDISRGKRDRATTLARERKSQQMAGLMALGLVVVFMSSGGGDGSGRSSYEENLENGRAQYIIDHGY